MFNMFVVLSNRFKIFVLFLVGIEVSEFRDSTQSQLFTKNCYCLKVKIYNVPTCPFLQYLYHFLYIMYSYIHSHIHTYVRMYVWTHVITYMCIYTYIHMCMWSFKKITRNVCVIRRKTFNNKNTIKITDIVNKNHRPKPTRDVRKKSPRMTTLPNTYILKFDPCSLSTFC